MKKLLFSFIFSCITLCYVIAQNGRISGVVIDKSNNESLIGATVTLNNTTKGSLVDVDGTYTITDVAPGKYLVKCTFISYEPAEKEIQVRAGETVSVDFSLMYSTTTLEAVTITAKNEQAATLSLISLARRSTTIVTGVSQDDIRRTPDRNTGEVLRRVSGTSIQDNKFVVIRGLADRYNVTLMNGMPLPSTEPDRRAFSFDIFPSNLLDNLLVYKTASADLPGEFAGGVVQLNTKEIPEKSFVQLSLNTSYNSQSTQKPYLTYAGGKTDWLGLDDGTRALPNVGTTKVYRQNEGVQETRYRQSKLFANDWKLDEKDKMGMAYGFQLSAGKRISIAKRDLGVIAALTYSRLPRISKVERNDFNSDQSQLYHYDDEQFRFSTNLGAMLNLSLEIDPKNRITFNNVYNISSQDVVVSRVGQNLPEERSEKANSVQFSSNQLFSSQLQGEHSLEGFKVKWGIDYNDMVRSTPSLRRMFYTRNLTPQFEGDTLFVAYVPQGAASPNYAGRAYLEQHEKQAVGNIDLIIPYTWLSQKNTLKFGAFLQTLSRSFDSRVFGYRYESQIYDQNFLSKPQGDLFKIENIGPSGFSLREATNPNDTYTASSVMPGLFGMFDQYINQKLRITGGIRMEMYNQKLDSKAYDGTPINLDTLTFDFLPSLNMSYDLNDRNKFRLAFSRTVSRPNFRELAPFSFYDFDIQAGIVGNPKLIRASILNADLRYEFYPVPSQLIALTAFYKQFSNPIEQITDAGTGGTSRQFTFQNAPKARNLGLELEFRYKPINLLTLFGNVSWISSKIDLSGIPNSYSKERPLQGQSPYVLNVGANFSLEDLGFSTTLLFNQIGRRIWQVGYTAYADIYEAPRGILDWSITQRIMKNGEIKFTISDILNKKAVFYQDQDKSGKYEVDKDTKIQGISFGTNYTLAISYKF